MILRDHREDNGVDRSGGAISHCSSEGAAYKLFRTVSGDGECEKDVVEQSLEKTVLAGKGKYTNDTCSRER